MQSCRISVNLEEVRHDIDCGNMSDIDGLRLRFTTLFYNEADASLIYRHISFSDYIADEFVVTVPKVDKSIDKEVVIMVDFVSLNAYGDAYSDVTYLKTSSLDSLRISFSKDIQSVDNAYYARLFMPSGQVSADAEVKDCFKDIDLIIKNALTFNNLEITTTFQSYFMFNDATPEMLSHTFNVTRPEEDVITIHIKHFGVSRTRLSISGVKEIQTIYIEPDERQTAVIYDPIDNTYEKRM